STRPDRFEPLGIAIAPSIVMGESRVALKRSPVRLRVVSSVSASRTCSTVPWGKVISAALPDFCSAMGLAGSDAAGEVVGLDAQPTKNKIVNAPNSLDGIMGPLGEIGAREWFL